MPKVVIVVSAYNVASTLAKTVKQIPEGLANEVVLVDDASRDQTAALGDQLGLRVIRHEHNQGYGGVQKTGYRAALLAGADIVALLHGDNQYDPDCLPLLIAPLQSGRADMTFGSRFAASGDPIAGGMPRVRVYGNRVTTILENLMVGARFTDWHSGMRAFNRRCLLSLPFLGYRTDFAFDTQTTVDAVTGGMRLVEIPIPTRYDAESSSIPFLGSIKYVGHTLGYVGRVAATRGRRGRRFPVVGKDRKPSRAMPKPTLDTLLATLQDFVLLQDRTLVVSREQPPSGHQSQNIEYVELNRLDHASEGAGAVIFVDPPEGEESIRTLLLNAARVLSSEGLILLPAYGPAESIKTMLMEAGFALTWWMNTREGSIAVGRSGLIS